MSDSVRCPMGDHAKSEQVRPVTSRKLVIESTVNL